MYPTISPPLNIIHIRVKEMKADRSGARPTTILITVLALALTLTLPQTHSALYTGMPPLQETPLWKIYRVPLYNPQWSPDASLLAVAVPPDNRIQIISRYGSPISYIQVDQTPIQAIAWNPRNTMIAIATQHQLIVLNKTTPIITIQHNNTVSALLSWNPQNNLLAARLAGPQGHTLYIINPETLQIVLNTTTDDFIQAITWNPVKPLLATTSWSLDPVTDKLRSTIQVYNAEGILAWEMTGIHGSLGTISWNPQGTILAASGNIGIMLITQTGEEQALLDADGTWKPTLAWSPDGSILSVGKVWRTRDAQLAHGAIELIDASTGKKLWETPDLNGTPDKIIWSPDATTVAAIIRSYKYKAGIEQSLLIILNAKTGTLLYQKILPSIQYTLKWINNGLLLAYSDTYNKTFTTTAIYPIPSTLLHMQAPPNTPIMIQGPDTNTTMTMTSEGKTSIFLTPGAYILSTINMSILILAKPYTTITINLTPQQYLNKNEITTATYGLEEKRNPQPLQPPPPYMPGQQTGPPSSPPEKPLKRTIQRQLLTLATATIIISYVLLRRSKIGNKTPA